MRVYSLPGDDLQLCVAAERSEFVMPSVGDPDAYFLRLYTMLEQETLGNSPD